MSTEVNKKRATIYVRKIAITAMLAALSTVLMFLSFPIPALLPGFLKMDFSELPALIASFVVSPLAGVAVCFVKNAINLFFTTTAGAGELCNFLLGACMVLPAGLIYKYKKNRIGALVACLAGCVAMALISLPINYFISYPVYYAMGFAEEAVLGMYQAINPNVSNLWDALLWFNAPFTFCKGLAVSIITYAVYKPLSNALKKLW